MIVRTGSDSDLKIGDISKGPVNYPAMIGTFKSIVLRDTTDESVVPIIGKFNNTLARTALVEKLVSEGLAPSQIYISVGIRLEYSDVPMSVRHYRTVTGVFSNNAKAMAITARTKSLSPSTR